MGALEGGCQLGRQRLAHGRVPAGEPVLIVAHPSRQLACREGLRAQHRPPGADELLPLLLAAVGSLAEFADVAQEAVDAGVGEDAAHRA
jgi:hypothetical protein